MHFCPHCNRSYERADHLSRHVTSHQNSRIFKCSECSKGFNRRCVESDFDCVGWFGC
ncbi:hypothetical protein IWZ01DRAFT_509914 [Phyllosticta capitalensis]